MEDELRKVDLIRERTHLGYEQARQLLQEAGGDVVSALILWERRRGPARLSEEAEEAVGRVRALWEKGNRTMLRIQRGDQTYLQVPVTVGVVGAVLAPYLAAAGAAACLLTGCRVSLERQGGRETGRAEESPAGDLRAADGTASGG